MESEKQGKYAIKWYTITMKRIRVSGVLGRELGKRVWAKEYIFPLLGKK